MSTQTNPHTPEFQAIIAQVEAALALAAEDARELAERTGTALVVCDMQKKQNGIRTERSSTPPMDAKVTTLP